MMKKVFVLFFILSALPCIGQVNFDYQRDFNTILARSKDPNDKLYYDKLLKRFQATDSTLTGYEVLALMIGFTDKPAYRPYHDLIAERTIYRLNGDKKYNEALDTATIFLNTHPLSLKTLFEKAYAFHKLNKEDSASLYLCQGRLILKAMRFSGDGHSPDTPIFALGPADGQDYIYKAGADIGTMGDGQDKYGNFLDILEAKLKDGKSVTLYFIIQHAADKMFDGRSAQDLIDEDKKNGK